MIDRQVAGERDDAEHHRELVSFSTSHACATDCIQVPISEISWPTKKSRKLRWRSARKAASLSAPVILRRNVAARLVRLGGFDFRYRVDDLTPDGELPSLPDRDLTNRVPCRDVASLQRSRRGKRNGSRESNCDIIDARGIARTLNLAAARSRRADDGVTLSARIDSAIGRSIVRVTVANRGGDPVRLTSAIFTSRPDFPRHAPARFFKHGYQSWSASGGPVGASRTASARRSEPFHRESQSSERDDVRPQDAPEGATSELFTIVESDIVARACARGIHRGCASLSTSRCESRTNDGAGDSRRRACCARARSAKSIRSLFAHCGGSPRRGWRAIRRRCSVAG